jgi:hypothetical protein
MLFPDVVAAMNNITDADLFLHYLNTNATSTERPADQGRHRLSDGHDPGDNRPGKRHPHKGARRYVQRYYSEERSI